MFDLLTNKMNSGLDAFTTEMKAQGVWDDITIVGVSEFGRTLTMNSGEVIYKIINPFYLIILIFIPFLSQRAEVTMHGEVCLCKFSFHHVCSLLKCAKQLTYFQFVTINYSAITKGTIL